VLVPPREFGFDRTGLGEFRRVLRRTAPAQLRGCAKCYGVPCSPVRFWEVPAHFAAAWRRDGDGSPREASPHRRSRQERSGEAVEGVVLQKPEDNSHDRLYLLDACRCQRRVVVDDVCLQDRLDVAEKAVAVVSQAALAAFERHVDGPLAQLRLFSCGEGCNEDSGVVWVANGWVVLQHYDVASALDALALGTRFSGIGKDGDAIRNRVDPSDSQVVGHGLVAHRANTIRLHAVIDRSIAPRKVLS